MGIRIKCGATKKFLCVCMITYDEVLDMSRPRFYDMNTRPLFDCLAWARYTESLGDDRSLRDERVDKYRVSTVYVGLDMGMFNALPLIFETMIFCDDTSDAWHMWMQRYTYRHDAIRGHEIAMRLVRIKERMER